MTLASSRSVDRMKRQWSMSAMLKDANSAALGTPRPALHGGDSKRRPVSESSTPDQASSATGYVKKAARCSIAEKPLPRTWIAWYISSPARLSRSCPRQSK